ncbi:MULTISPECIES: retroviral-like aspartic protease family protein [unclassified Sphingopyxis]|uniref:retroviral-like aspartic protease family protein n=1 Tax=unclassified Sphingopyxis TaxID=2614943 RepID=UPI0025F70DF8|nr:MULTISPECIES: retroviral-like aspartic protease family protein [unclassified Sphingopyxis]
MTHLFRRSMFWTALLAAPVLIGASQTPPAPPVLAAPSSPGPAEVVIEPGTVSEVVPFIQPFDLDATRRMAVNVMVGGQGPFSFLVDTGAERTVIARELAARLGLVEGAKLRLATIGGSATVPSFRIAALQMSDLHLASVDAPAFHGRHIGAAGLIGVDMLEERRVLIDFRKERMQILETRRRAPSLIRDDDAIVVTARNSAGRLILTDARLHGRRIDVIVDTGAQTSVGNMALQKMVADRRANRLPFSATELTAVTGEDVPALRTAIKRIVINGLDINDLPVSFADSQAFRVLGLHERPALLLGMDSLSLFDRVEIDFPNKRVVFDLPDGAQRRTGQQMALTMARHGG